MSIMDINDIIGEQSEAAMESTLESEIDALSKIITDSKDDSQKLEDNDEDFKLDNDDIAFADSLQCDSIESDTCELLPEDRLGLKDFLDNPTELENFISTSVVKNTLQEISKETSESVAETQESKEGNDNVSQEQAENSEATAVFSITTNQNSESGIVLETELSNVNSSLSLISEAYNSQESQSYSGSQPASVSGIEEVAESLNGIETDNVENQQNSTETCESTFNNIETDPLVPILATEVCNKADSPEDNPVEEKLDDKVDDESMEQKSRNQSNENRRNDQLDFVPFKNFAEKEDSTNECVPVEDVQKKDSTMNADLPTEENVSQETLMEIDNFNDKEKSNLPEQDILSIIKTNEVEETNDFVKEIITQNDKEAKSEENIGEILEENEKCEETAIENKAEEMEESFHSVETEFVESDIPILETKDPLETEEEDSVTNIPHDDKQIIGESEASKDNDSTEALQTKNAVFDKEIIQENITEFESKSMITSDIDQKLLQPEEPEKIDEIMPMLFTNPLNTNIENVENKETAKEIATLENVATCTNKNVESLKNTDDQKNIETLQSVNVDANITFSEAVEQITEGLQEAEVNSIAMEIVEKLQGTEVDTNIEEKDVESLQVTIDTANSGDKDCKNLQEIEEDSNVEEKDVSLQETVETANFEEADHKSLHEIEEDSNIETKDVESLQEKVETANFEETDRQSLQEVEDSNIDKKEVEILQLTVDTANSGEKDYKNLQEIEEDSNVEKKDFECLQETVETANFEETDHKSLQEVEEDSNIEKKDVEILQETIETANSEEKDCKSLQEIEEISNVEKKDVESLQEVVENENSEEKEVKSLQEVEVVSNIDKEDVESLHESKENTNVEERSIEHLQEAEVDSNNEKTSNAQHSQEMEVNPNIEKIDDTLQETEMDTNLEEICSEILQETDIDANLEKNNAEILQNAESDNIKNTNIDVSNQTFQEAKTSKVEIMQEKDVLNVTESLQNIKSLQETETNIDSKILENIESLENPNLNVALETLQETQTSTIVETSQDITDVGVEFLENENRDNIKSPKEEIQAENESVKTTVENVDKENIISPTETEITDEIKIAYDKEALPEQSFSTDNDIKDVANCGIEENKEVMETDVDLITDQEPESSILNKDICESSNKDEPESQIISDQNVQPLESNEPTKTDQVRTEESMNEDLALTKIETPEDVNITLQFDELETVEKIDLTETNKTLETIEKTKLITVKNKETTMEEKVSSVEINVQKQLIETEMKQVNIEDEVDQVEMNLSLVPEEYNSPVIQELPEEQLTLDDPLNDLVDSKNVNTAEIAEILNSEVPDLSEILDVNQKVDELMSGDQDSDSQELASRLLNEVEKDLGADLSDLLETEETINKNVRDFGDSETSSLPDRDLQSLDEKSQDSLSILDALQADPISTEQDKEESKEFESVEKEEDITLMFEDSSQSPRQSQDDKFVNDLYNSCVPDDTIESNDAALDNITKCNDPASINERSNKADLETKEIDIIPKEFENTLEIEGNAQLEEIEVPEDNTKLFLDSIENEETTVESQAEISELESAVKFLQESEEQDIETSKMVDDITASEENSSIFVSVEDSLCDNVSELVSDLPEATLDPIAISEAEIISEAAKLESERKEKLESEQLLKSSVQESSDSDSMDAIEKSALPATDNLLAIVEPNEQIDVPEVPTKDTSQVPLITETKLTSESLPRTSMLDERYKVPPKIEIPEVSPKICDLPLVQKTCLLMQKDAKQRLESPDRQTATAESKITETSKKDIDKQQPQQQQYSECENVGSPRIILKIAKSAIAECSEPRSPKSPKIRSAANSPNPEDSPGHKLGKIKLKLSKGGHPSIIPNNDNYDETAQWHTDSTSSLSPLGMKIKLTKSGDASVVENKYEETQKQEETKEKASHKGDEGRKTEASIGMKIKLSKSGDASIVQQDNSPKESTQDVKQKHKESKEIAQETSTAKKQDSPSIGMKIKLSKSGDASIIQQDSKPQSAEDYKETVSKAKDKTVEDIQESTKRTESPIGMKIKLSKSGDASVISSDTLELSKEMSAEMKERAEEPSKRTDSPIGVKIKLAKTKGGNASIIPPESAEEVKDKADNAEAPKKVKVTRKREVTEDIHEASSKAKDKSESDVTKQQEVSKSKIAKLAGGESDIATTSDTVDETLKAGIGMKIKLSKSGDASVVHTKKEDSPVESIKKSTEQPIGMKIKLSKTGDPSIIHSELSKEAEDVVHSVKTKHSKSKDHGTVSQQKTKDDSHLEMKIKLSKTGHPTIITTNELQEDPLKIANLSATQSYKHKDHKDILTFKESTLKALKKSHADVTIEPIKSQSIESTMIDLHNKRKEITIAPIETKKLKIEANIKQMLPDVTIQPIISVAKKEQQQQQQQQKLLLESNSTNISRQQMNVINQEISITQICSLSSGDTLMGERLKSALNVQPSASSPLNSDCEIIEPQPELIFVNENSNSSQDIMIIDEVPPSAKSAVKMPKKRGRPRRNAVAAAAAASSVTGFHELELQRDPLSLDQPPLPILQQQMQMQMHMQIQMQAHMQHQMHQQVAQQVAQLPGQVAPVGAEGSERPRRTCRSQKSYAPPKRGRGRGRGKRKNEASDIPMKKPRIEQDLTAIENSTTAVIALEKIPLESSSNINNSPELFKALNQPTLEQATEHLKEVEILEIPKSVPSPVEHEQVEILPQEEVQVEIPEMQEIQEITEEVIEMTEETAILCSDQPIVAAPSIEDVVEAPKVAVEEEPVEKADGIVIKVTEDDKPAEATVGEQSEVKDRLTIQEHQNWLAPSVKKMPSDSAPRTESISTLTVIDEETRMSAESGSRSQTPARSMAVPGTSETLANEESQGSVLSTATTESEKVKVKNRRMEISFDPDEGPFTVEKIAEYEWPLERKEERPAAARGETFMIQEQISQYLGVKSFKRKYPDLKRRMVDMEERNFLRENGLVSESMCDMGLTAVSSSEVLDIMCSDFPEQYEEYRKHMREKAAKEHSKKQKELSAAANAERNRIDLAEMAMQSAISWNAGLNKARQDSRKCSLDLQTFTVHMPKRPIKLDPSRRGSHYPVALIPGQYTDYYREYTPAELRYYPLNTVLYGPMRPNERKFDSQSEGSQSDSDSDSSSDDSSSSSSEGTQDTEGSQSTMDEVDMDLALQPDIKCKMCLNNLNKNNRPEVLIQCGTCNGNVHPSCIDLTLDMVPHIRAYAWQCTDCKTCAQCHDPADEDKMLFCDMCDRGYHIYCVGLRRVPQGRWHCQECAVCANCGSKEPGGANSDRNSVAQWQHEYKKGDKNTRVYVSTFCVPCSKLWRKGRYCPHCSRCHNAPRLDLEPNLVHCGACDKYLHLGCVETKGLIIDKKHYFCEFCSPNRQQLVKPLMSKTFKT